MRGSRIAPACGTPFSHSLPERRNLAPENTIVISLKKYLDMEPDQRSKDEPDPRELFPAAMESYRSALLAMAKGGTRACPALGSDLQQNLTSLEQRLANQITSALLLETGSKVEEQLYSWGGQVEEYFKARANDAKELLMVLAHTAASVGERDQRYTNQFTDFTSRLQKIADLEDLSQVRASLVQRANELKTYVDKMERDSHESVAQLRAAVSTYETRLKAVETIALRDGLTGLSNRSNVEERIEWRIAQQQVFCLVILDLNRFKQVNDRYGHLAGDDLLKQFAQELRANLRSTDLVGRWGGDEFILVIDCDLPKALVQVERLQKWLFGEYTIQLGAGKGETKVHVDAALGLAQWQAGETLQEVMGRADAAMYQKKQSALSSKQ
jgi:diguanylate cyclase (GGDEF)-like protein